MNIDLNDATKEQEMNYKINLNHQSKDKIKIVSIYRFTGIAVKNKNKG